MREYLLLVKFWLSFNNLPNFNNEVKIVSLILATKKGANLFAS